MSPHPIGMSSNEIDELLAQVAGGAVAPKTAVALMLHHGEDRTRAARLVFHALGGSDTTELDPQGRPRYVESGKLVADVEKAIADMDQT